MYIIYMEHITYGIEKSWKWLSNFHFHFLSLKAQCTQVVISLVLDVIFLL